MEKLKRFALDSVSGLSSSSANTLSGSYGSRWGGASTDFRAVLEQALVGIPPTTIATSAVAATVSVLTIFRLLLYSRGSKRQVIPSPLLTVLPHLSEREKSKLQYQPDQLPGARDVSTPYGSIRVYEWGPKNGPRVLLIHNLTTACMTMEKIARGLVKRGCRVMLFDLFGRGFSDGVGDLPHDARLYVSQILLAISSSTLPWTGKNGMRVIGHSIGGAIAVHFATTFPHMVSSLVLIAPGGLMRTSVYKSSFFFLVGLMPKFIVAALARPIIRPRSTPSPKKRSDGKEKKKDRDREKSVTIRDTSESERIADVEVLEGTDPPSRAESTALESSALKHVGWQINNHAGFVPAVVSCFLFGPLTNQHEAWKGLAQRDRGSTLIILGEADDTIKKDQFIEDASPLMGGKSHARWKVLPGGQHFLTMTHPREILAELDSFWGRQ